MTQEGNKALQLVIEKTTGRYIDVSINAAGSLYVTGVDDGPLTSAFFGKSDYEYFITIEAQHKDLLLLHLIKALHGHDGDVTSTITKIAKENGIPYSFASY